jgi:hypothetical protein
LVVEGEMAIKEDAKVACSIGRLDDCVCVNMECRTVKLGKLSRVAEDKKFGLRWVDRKKVSS